MTEPIEPQKHEHKVEISFTPAPPRPKKVRKWVDVPLIVISCGIIATVFHSSALFGVLCGAMLLLYLIGGPKAPKPAGQ